jgi:hypothetical protein
MQAEQAGMKTNRKNMSDKQTGRLNLFFNPSIIVSRVTATLQHGIQEVRLLRHLLTQAFFVEGT